MAHKKAAGAARQQGNRQGKRRGIKRSDGQAVTPGTIIVRQVGTVYKAGQNTKLAKDFTIFSKISGVVRFKDLTKSQKIISVE